MRRFLASAAIGAALLMATSLQGQIDLLGKDAPGFRLRNPINESAIKTLDDARAEVILIKYWGIK